MQPKTKGRSIGEICKDPDSMTEAEKKDMTKLFEAFRELGKAVEPYSNIKPIIDNNLLFELNIFSFLIDLAQKSCAIR